MTTKLEEERYTLALAVPLLRKLYGPFEIDEDQQDRPDAALILEDGRRVGVEITTLDHHTHRQYDRDPRIDRAAREQQLKRTLAGLPPLNAPLKAQTIKLGRDYLAAGAMSKATKYSQYMGAGGFDEVILLTSSAYIRANHRRFQKYYVAQAGWLFHSAAFPFNKVVFVCHDTNDAILVHDSRSPITEGPADYLYPALTVRTYRIHGSVKHVLPLNQIMATQPLAPSNPPPPRSRPSTKEASPGSAD
jgi:hypothetical protein